MCCNVFFCFFLWKCIQSHRLYHTYFVLYFTTYYFTSGFDLRECVVFYCYWSLMLYFIWLVRNNEIKMFNQKSIRSLQWHHNGCNGISNHQSQDCFLNHSFRHKSKKTSNLRVTGLCAGNSPVTGEFPPKKASNAENVFIWWCYYVDVQMAGGASGWIQYTAIPTSVEQGKMIHWHNLINKAVVYVNIVSHQSL